MTQTVLRETFAAIVDSVPGSRLRNRLYDVVQEHVQLGQRGWGAAFLNSAITFSTNGLSHLRSGNRL